MGADSMCASTGTARARTVAAATSSFEAAPVSWLHVVDVKTGDGARRLGASPP